MPPSLGLSVLNVKDDASRDPGSILGHSVLMGSRSGNSKYRYDFVLRVRAARRALGEEFTQEKMAGALQIDQGTYKTYESLTKPRPLPPQLQEPFCAICHVKFEWLITGHGNGPRIEQPHELPKKRRSRRKPVKSRSYA